MNRASTRLGLSEVLSVPVVALTGTIEVRLDLNLPFPACDTSNSQVAKDDK
jgi:hypothetical protein